MWKESKCVKVSCPEITDSSKCEWPNCFYDTANQVCKPFVKCDELNANDCLKTRGCVVELNVCKKAICSELKK